MMKIGHRGAPGFPRRGENTIHSFHKALASGANAIEFDVRKTKDGKLVVIHDATLDRTTDGKGRVSELFFSDMARYNAGAGAGFIERVPLLSEILNIFGRLCFLHIELKVSGIAKEVKKMILDFYLRYSVCVSAFDHDDCDKDSSSSWNDLKHFLPEIPIALIARAKKIARMGMEEYAKTARAMEAMAIHPAYSLCNEDLVRYAHEQNLLINVWTVNDPLQIEHYKSLGVTGIASDFPERL